ncbi:hypothetical protein Scep_014335 [Stephania cephalantha]|uniref:Uncharacterized protein n=1 Tax=Stephania cephalantha TaxID=152367 RepID=A0AAP0J126_9MAGN
MIILLVCPDMALHRLLYLLHLPNASPTPSGGSHKAMGAIARASPRRNRAFPQPP